MYIFVYICMYIFTICTYTCIYTYICNLSSLVRPDMLMMTTVVAFGTYTIYMYICKCKIASVYMYTYIQITKDIM